MTGDAAFSPSLLSGMGSSLALIGAYVLAGELGRHTDHREAFRAYETITRPYVGQAQALPLGASRIALPKSRTGIRTLNAVLGMASQRRVGASAIACQRRAYAYRRTS